MKARTLKELKDELAFLNQEELKALCLHLVRFKKDNKELLTYLLFEAQNEALYIEKVKGYIEDSFAEINTRNYYYIRKSVRKILSTTKKYIRYSKKKETEVELLLYFCEQLKDLSPSYRKSIRLQGIFDTQIRMIKKAMVKLHEDLQYDLNLELEKLLTDG